MSDLIRHLSVLELASTVIPFGLEYVERDP